MTSGGWNRVMWIFGDRVRDGRVDARGWSAVDTAMVCTMPGVFITPEHLAVDARADEGTAGRASPA